jgi:hypothetical protein
VEVVAALVADKQSLELVQPGEGAFDDPAPAAETRAVRAVATGDHRLDAPLAELAPLRRVVVGTVCDEPLGAPTRSPAAAAHGGHAVDERDQLGDVVAVAAGDRPGERRAASIDEEVVLRAGAAAIDRARARRGAPLFACTCEESATARDQSS